MTTPTSSNSRVLEKAGFSSSSEVKRILAQRCNTSKLSSCSREQREALAKHQTSISILKRFGFNTVEEYRAAAENIKDSFTETDQIEYLEEIGYWFKRANNIRQKKSEEIKAATVSDILGVQDNIDLEPKKKRPTPRSSFKYPIEPEVWFSYFYPVEEKTTKALNQAMAYPINIS